MVQLRSAEGEHLFGVVRYVGEAPGAAGRWAGVEMEGELKGGHAGLVAGQRLFTCAPGKGVLVPVTHLTPDPRFAESLPPTVQQDFGGIECPPVLGHHPPHTGADPAAIHGRNRGIQGHQNSCYLDATLFSMFCFTSAFDSLLYRPRNKGDVAKYDEVQQVLRDEIVNPLRRSLYVRADRVMKLRELLASLSDVQGLTDQEKDPEEFLSSLLTQVMKAEPYLELSSGQTAHHYQLFVEKDPELALPSVQDLFDQSFNASRVKLRKAPPVLILQMPRWSDALKPVPGSLELVSNIFILQVRPSVQGVRADPALAAAGRDGHNRGRAAAVRHLRGARRGRVRPVLRRPRIRPPVHRLLRRLPRPHPPARAPRRP